MSRCKGNWKRCNNVISESVANNAIIVNNDCTNKIDNRTGDYIVFKPTCDGCKNINLKESEGEG